MSHLGHRSKQKLIQFSEFENIFNCLEDSIFLGSTDSAQCCACTGVNIF